MACRATSQEFSSFPGLYSGVGPPETPPSPALQLPGVDGDDEEDDDEEDDEEE